MSSITPLSLSHFRISTHAAQPSLLTLLRSFGHSTNMNASNFYSSPLYAPSASTRKFFLFFFFSFFPLCFRAKQNFFSLCPFFRLFLSFLCFFPPRKISSCPDVKLFSNFYVISSIWIRIRDSRYRTLRTRSNLFLSI